MAIRHLWRVANGLDNAVLEYVGKKKINFTLFDAGSGQCEKGHPQMTLPKFTDVCTFYCKLVE